MIPTTVIAPVKSAWASKTNWIAAIGAIIALLNELLPIVPAQYQHDVTVAVTVLTAISTIISRTFFTTTLTPSSVKQ